MIAEAHHEGRVADDIRPLAQRRSDASIEAAFEGQHHVMTLAQLEELGLSARAVRHRMTAGRLRRMHRGVYAIGRPTTAGRWMAAVLAAGGGAVLSHRSAAALWGLRADMRARIDVTVMGGSGRVRAGIDFHSGASLEPADVDVKDGIPCTSLVRTMIDLAAVVDRRSLERAVDRAEELRAFDLGAVAAMLARARGRRGAANLAAVLDAYEGPVITRSEIEERLLELIASARLPRPQVNEWIPLEDGTGYRPDFLWRDARLVVEVDGRTYHARRSAFRHDRQRDRRLALAGFETRRYDASEVVEHGGRVIDEIRAFLHGAMADDTRRRSN
ncbi:MAG: type IV toxin-antitoxin system AbiEi family antitoxin domain-containing protein [Thermoleophilaceae bacterium]